MNVGFLLALIHVNSVLGASEYGCAMVDDFHKDNLKYFSSIANLQEKTKGLWLHEALKKEGKEIGRGGFGVVRSVIGGKEDLVMKIQNPNKISRHVSVEREIILMKYLCEVDFDRDFSEFIPCEGKAIAPFKGCVEDDNGIFIIQRMAHFSLEDGKALKKYRSFEPMDRLAVILKILDKVIELHDKGIIHSDIKPGNIVTRDPELQEIELIDLGVAGIDTLEFYGGTNAFLPPESLPNHNMRKLSPQLDIYSLAITMMFLEKGFTEEYDRISPTCFTVALTLTCYKEVMAAVTKILYGDNGLLPLLPIISKALSYKKTERQNSVEELSKSFVKAIKSIPRYECYFHYLVVEEESRAQQKPQQSRIYKWLEYARASKLLVKIPINLTPSGLASKCKNYNRPTASPTSTQQSQSQSQSQLRTQSQSQQSQPQPQQLLKKLEQKIKELPKKHKQQLQQKTLRLQQKKQPQQQKLKANDYDEANLVGDASEEKEAQVLENQNLIVHSPANIYNARVVATFSYEEEENDPALELEGRSNKQHLYPARKFRHKPEFSKDFQQQHIEDKGKPIAKQPLVVI